MSMQTVFQLWGLEPAGGLDAAHMLRVLDRVLAAKPLAVVAGQTDNAALLRAVCDRAHAAGVRVHQWASLFSENDFAADFDPILGADGQPLPRLFGEHFFFRCPASDRNVELFARLQSRAMGDIPFDGVFLDRVRYPSFANGGLHSLACFCPACMRRYEAAGVDADRLRRMLNRPEGPNPLGIAGFENGNHTFADPDVSRFFAMRAERITHAVKTLRERFGEVSLDLFPPALAYLTGQSLRDLAPLAAFVKPMLYRFTTAPAGLPFELEAYARAGGDVSALPCGVQEQVRAYAAVASGLMWGVEGGRIPGTVDTNPERIRETIGLIAQAGGTGVCASWSAATFPEENLAVFLSQGE